MQRFAARSSIAQCCLTWNCIARCCTMLCCWVPYCIALPDLELGCTALPFPVPYCIVLPCPALRPIARSAITLLAVLRCAAGCRAALYCLILDCIAWSYTTSGFALHRPALPALELHSSAPHCPVPRCCPALTSAAQGHAAQGCPLPACVMPSHLVPRCLLYPMLPDPARVFVVPYGVVLPSLLPAAPPWALLHATAFSSSGLQSLRVRGPSTADPSQDPAPPCPALSVLPLSHHQPPRPSAVWCLGAKSCPGSWQPMGLPRMGAHAGGGILREGTGRSGVPRVVAWMGKGAIRG